MGIYCGYFPPKVIGFYNLCKLSLISKEVLDYTVCRKNCFYIILFVILG